jgi:P-type Ca2+ transporter type 2C
MACLFGFIVTFLGSSLLWIAQGTPFLPLQTLWINFTVQVFLAIGLGYGKAREGLMGDAPRPPSTPILSTRLLVWLVIAGITMAVITLGVISWATVQYGDAVARTMGLTAFALTNIWFALETSDEDNSVFSNSILANPTLLKMAGLAIIATVVTSEIGLLNRLIGTVNLSTEQWGISIVASLAIVVLCEIKKLLKIRTTEAAVRVVPEAAPAAA